VRLRVVSIASRASFRKSGSCIINADYTVTTHVLGKLHVALVFDEVSTLTGVGATGTGTGPEACTLDVSLAGVRRKVCVELLGSVRSIYRRV